MDEEVKLKEEREKDPEQIAREAAFAEQTRIELAVAKKRAKNKAEKEADAKQKEERIAATLTSLKDGTLFRVDHNAPPLPSTEEEIRACAAKLASYVKAAKEDGIEQKDLPAYIRTQVGWHDYKPER